jgi:hypothetical protein
MPRNILIDPQRTGTGNPNIQFSGSMANTIKLEVLTSGSVQFAGVSGSLLSITDTLSGSLFAVSDVSGLPILETFSDDRVVMGQFNTAALVVTGSQVGIGVSNPTATARLFVSGTSTSGLSTLTVKAGVASPTGAIIDVQNSNGVTFFVLSGSGLNSFVSIGPKTTTSNLLVAGTSDSSAISTSVAGIFKVSGSSSATLALGSYLNSPFGMYMQTNGATYPIIIQPAGGPVGIGTSTASARLHLLGSTTTTIPTLLVKEAQAMATATATVDVQNSAGTSLFFVTGSARVGIGTITPNETLSVHNGSQDRVGLGVSGAVSTLYLGSKTSTEAYRTLEFSRSTGNLDLYYGAVGSAMTSALTVDSSGKIGIGATAAYTAKLHVFGSTTATTPTMVVREGVVSPTGGVGTFDVQNSAGTSLLFVSGSGNVGIGTATNLSTLTVNGGFAAKAPSNVNAATYTVTATDYSLRFTTTNCTVTLPAAASFPGRILILNTITANSATSAASNVKPLGSDTAGTPILAATAGKFAEIQSDGTNWVTLTAN